MKHKENIENIYKRKLEDEKRKLLKSRVDEVDRLVKENKKLNAKIGAKWWQYLDNYPRYDDHLLHSFLLRL